MNEFRYEGEELELFREAGNWKKYFAHHLKPYIQGTVLEVGAGLGETTSYLFNQQVSHWTCLEPDPRFYETLLKKTRAGSLPQKCIARQGTLDALSPGEKFDTILYIDVLEHIERDREEMQRASLHLNAGGHIIVLSPAYNSVYNSFDKAIGHYRRYNRKTLKEAGRVPALKEVRMFFLESMGVFLLLVNKLLARKKYPSVKQVRLWDKLVVPVSRITDKLVFYFFGKTIVGIWQYHE